MKYHIALPILAAVAIICAGCTTVKRFKSAKWISEDLSLVDMDLFGATLLPEDFGPTEKDLWDLSAGAQTQLIRILNERYPENDRFIHALNVPYRSEELRVPAGYTRKDLRMVFTVNRHRDYKHLNDASSRFSPADRIEYLAFTLEIPGEYNLRFDKWNRYATEYGTLEIADVSFTRSLNLDLESDLDTPGDARIKGMFGKSEEQEVRRRYLILNGSISDRRIRMEEEGTREVDLTGNVVADVGLVFSGFPERITLPLYAGEPEPNSAVPEVAALDFRDVMVPRLEGAPDTLYAILKASYIYRHVREGWKTFAEWDDRVEYYSGSIVKRVPLFSRKDYLPGFYCLGWNEPSGRTDLGIRTVSGDYPLQFMNYRDAANFRLWMLSRADSPDEIEQDSVISAGPHGILFRGKPLTAAVLSAMPDVKVLPAH